MPDAEQIAVVFTFKSIERLIKEGGTSSWRLDRNHARQCAYAVCTRNARSPYTEGPEPHHTAFLIGKVKDVVPAPGRQERFLIQFSEYALVNIPNAWTSGRNPVSYGSLEQLGIEPSALDWRPMPEVIDASQAMEAPTTGPSVTGLTMAEAKRGLAHTFGVSPEAIEITIRG